MENNGDEIFLSTLGERVRQRRQGAGLSQSALARESRLSPRFISQVETGRANISVLRLRQLSHALRCPLTDLVAEIETPTLHGIVALIGLRGAGKSAVGSCLAKRLGRPFVELDDRVAEEAGLGLSEMFAIHGEAYYRRLERDALQRFVAEGRGAVLATGGGLVTSQPTYELLKQSATTIWLSASPEDHLSRVVAQGDSRPMAGHANPLGELSALLEKRAALYAEADLTFQTSGITVEEVADAVARRLS